MIKVSGYLTSHILVALPTEETNELSESVIFICKHDENGAMGFVINQTLEGVFLSDIIPQISYEEQFLDVIPFKDPPIFWGGPVENNRGFVLHSLDYSFENTVAVDHEYGVTANVEALKHIMSGKSQCAHSTIFLGYAGWKAGQLEKEIAHHAWLPLPASFDLLFKTPPLEKWEASLSQLGLDQLAYSPIQGHA